MVAAAAPAGAVSFLSAGTSSACAASCFTGGNSYKITWSAADLAGRLGIQNLKLDRKVLGDMQNYSFKVTFENAAGEQLGDWGSFMIAGLGGDEVNLFGQGFFWDASKGDLVMKLTLAITGQGGGGGGYAFSGGGGGGGGGASSSSAAVDDGVGVLDDVNTPDIGRLRPVAGPPSAAIVAPEPSSWGLMLVGFGVAGGLLRRRRMATFG